jgi:hypothetical protein
MRPASRTWLPGVRSRAPLIALLLSLLTIGAMAIPALARLQEDAAAPLTGMFMVSIVNEDVADTLAGGDALVGRWTLELGDAGTYGLARQDVGEVASGRFAAGPATLAFEDWSGIVGCEDSGSDGSAATYAWRLSDDLLTLTPIDEPCIERLTLLTTRALVQVEACEDAPVAQDPFSMVEAFGTPVAESPETTGVAAQEGFSEGEEAEKAIDALLRSANGCWAVAEPDRFMALHSGGLTGQIAIMGPVDAFTRELRTFMEAPLTLERISDVTLEDPGHAWAYVEVTLDGQPNPQRMNFVFEQGVWKLDTFFLFGPPTQGPPIGPMP